MFPYNYANQYYTWCNGTLFLVCNGSMYPIPPNSMPGVQIYPPNYAQQLHTQIPNIYGYYCMPVSIDIFNCIFFYFGNSIFRNIFFFLVIYAA